MASTVQKPEVLNDLLKNILLSMFNQAQEEFEDRTGRKIKPSRLDAMKIKIAGAAVNSAMHIFDKLGDPHDKFERFVGLTNQHLPTIVGIVGEEAVVKRLNKIPDDVLNRDVIKILDQAGAHEVAKLLAQTLPPEQRSVLEKPKAPEASPPPVVTATPEAVVTTTVEPPAATMPFADAAKPVREGESASAEPSFRPQMRRPANDTATLLRGQLQTLISLRDSFDRPIAELREKILELELPSRPLESKRGAVLEDFVLRR